MFKYQTYLKATLFLPLILPLTTILLYYFFDDDLLESVIPQPLYSTMLISIFGLLYAGIPYLIFMMYVFVKLNSWTYSNTIKFVKKSPLYVSAVYTIVIFPFSLFLAMETKFSIMETILLFLFVCLVGVGFIILFGYFYVLLVLGGLKLGKKRGYITT